MLRIIVTPAAEPHRPGLFHATLDPVTSLRPGRLVTSHQPLTDSARVLLAEGFDPATLLTMRHAGKAYDSFVPMPIGEWAKVTYEEGAKSPVKKRIWKAMPDSVSRGEGRSKVEVEAPAGTPAPD